MLQREYSDIFSDYATKQDNKVEELRHYFCKKMLNVGKYVISPAATDFLWDVRWTVSRNNTVYCYIWLALD